MHLVAKVASLSLQRWILWWSFGRERPSQEIFRFGRVMPFKASSGTCRSGPEQNEKHECVSVPKTVRPHHASLLPLLKCGCNFFWQLGHTDRSGEMQAFAMFAIFLVLFDGSSWTQLYHIGRLGKPSNDSGSARSRISIWQARETVEDLQCALQEATGLCRKRHGHGSCSEFESGRCSHTILYDVINHIYTGTWVLVRYRNVRGIRRWVLEWFLFLE